MQEIIESIPANEYNTTLEKMYQDYSTKTKDEIVLVYNAKFKEKTDKVTVEQVSDLI